ncbi:dTDP-4-dehydrorhamnose 3,5-epimerase family protein [Streptomyces globisporus]|uniref:dTDP-4-dehydrorhamnose 3,5-epimerase family protein n=1 Tax=Streptomyces TaxID=1883 RepID=UPI0004CC80E6|nr:MULTISPECIES: dTDP-4-dehydrorhamnose 3,5-epimerase family protein [Streptomyces]PPA38198.1 dTDP-4-dehydrorhamnose 3,5-epimerase [Streptomyces griseus]RAN13425.1 dTDP-4-dehydrorhamnose 3,5-epimerase [Streptomyces badius]AWL90780.1 dTDP-4-keto-6-deoxy-D-glucose epimerase [Streptomyces globisporus]MBK3556855.1 dTDP-4-dehydrorhamnose 3,5-epimerase family protein [Streptomyces sp. MBT56]MBK3602092.1 dTDP-4-dehydrorhamnose 3,5-epimerase family protein [Streptomyces sp. MBT54]
MKPIGISGAWTEEKQVFRDERGSFREWFQGEPFRRTVGHSFDLRQANCAISSHGVLRGIHFAGGVPGQAKYFSCLRGSVLGAVVDIRVGSPTFGGWRTVELGEENGRALYVSAGLGFGFLTLSDEAVIVYLCSAAYDPRLEHGLNPLDPEVGIAWPPEITPILSERDSSAPGLAEAGRRGWLPSHSGRNKSS